MEQAEMELEVKEHREKQREAIIYKALRHAMAALAERGLRYVALLAAVGFFAWALYDPLTSRIAAAGIFTGMVFLPLLFKRGGGDAD
jgi:hypothetical protein